MICDRHANGFLERGSTAALISSMLFSISNNVVVEYKSKAFLLGVPGLVSSDVALDDDGFLFEEPEVPPAEEPSDVPLDGDGRPGLGAGPPGH